MGMIRPGQPGFVEQEQQAAAAAGGGNNFNPAASGGGGFNAHFGGIDTRLDNIMAQLGQGATQQQQQMVQQIGNDLFSQGANQIQEQAQRLMSGVSSSAASRGLIGSSIGLGGATAVGRRGIDRLAQLRAGINSQSMQQLLQLPFQTAGMGMQGLGILGGLQGQHLSAEAAAAAAERGQRSNALWGAIGGGLGSLFGPIGTAIGSSVGNQIGGGGEN